MRLIILPSILISCSIIFLSFFPLQEGQYAKSSDEGYYYHYAQQVKEQGAKAFRNLLYWYASDIEARKHPAPIRIGYIASVATLFQIFGPSYSVIGAFSGVCFLLFLLLNAYFFRKKWGDIQALSMTLLLASSPLLLGLSRRALIDVPILLFWSGMFWAFLYLMETCKKRYMVMFCAFCIGGLLFKESTLLILGVLFTMGALFMICKKSVLSWSMLLVTICVPIILISCIYIIVLGGVNSFLSGVMAIFGTHVSVASLSPYAVNFCSGPWHRYLIDFMLINPIVTLCSICGACLILSKQDAKLIDWFVLAFFIGVYFIFSLFPYSKVVRFVLILEVPLVIFAVRGLSLIYKQGEDRRRKVSLGTVCFLIATVNFGVFYKVFYSAGLLDPITQHLASFAGFIPF